MSRAFLVFFILAATVLAGSCSRQNGDSVLVGELVLVRLNVTGSTVLVGFMMCDELACNKIEVLGVSEKRSISFYKYIDCGPDGYGGRRIETSSTVDRKYPPSALVVVSRNTTTLSVWPHDAPEATVSLPIASSQQYLYIKDHWDAYFSPGEVSIEFLAGNSWRRECWNGGWFNSTAGLCSCPPGFDGPSCEEACGPDRYGSRCAERCSRTGNGCRRRKLAWSCGAGSRCTSCAAGLHGSLCDKVCHSGQYGSDCLQRCGRCLSDSPCDVYTGQCASGCVPGFHGLTCHRELSHLISGPNITSVADTSFKGHVITAPVNLDGSGAVMYVEVQYKEVGDVDGGEWVSALTLCLGDACSPTAGSSDVPALLTNFTVDGLRPGQRTAVRVLLLDRQLRGFTDVPHVEITTLGSGEVFNVTVFEVTPNEAQLGWSSPKNQTFFVRCTCVRLLACPESCLRSSRTVSVDVNSARLTDLLPGAEYSVVVSAASDLLHGVVVSVITKFAVPGVAIESAVEHLSEDSCSEDEGDAGFGVARRNNASATLRWLAPRSCRYLNGPLVGYHWELVPAACPDCARQSSTTRRTSVTLVNLLPATRYDFKVNLENTVGFNPEMNVSLSFATARLKCDEATVRIG